MATNYAAGTITNIFVLVLENRAFDHMLGFSGITGTDAVTGKPTSINGLTGSESNTYNGQTYPVTHPADYQMAQARPTSCPTLSRSSAGRVRPFNPGIRIPRSTTAGSSRTSPSRPAGARTRGTS